MLVASVMHDILICGLPVYLYDSPTHPPLRTTTVSIEFETDSNVYPSEEASHDPMSASLDNVHPNMASPISKAIITKKTLDDLSAKSLQKYRVIKSKHAHKQMEPLPAGELVLASRVLWIWKFKRMMNKLGDEVMKTVFMTDEANAICAALDKPDKFRVELLTTPQHHHASHLVQHTGVSPIQRIRYMKHTVVRVVQWKRSGYFLIWDRDSFIEQLYQLREIYHDVLETGESYQEIEKRERENKDIKESPGPSQAASSPPPGGRARIGSTISRLLNRQSVQSIGHAYVYLEALRFGQPIFTTAQVLDPRGDLAGTLSVELIISTVERRSLFMNGENAASAGVAGDQASAPPPVAVRMSHRRRSSTDATDAILSLTVRVSNYDACSDSRLALHMKRTSIASYSDLQQMGKTKPNHITTAASQARDIWVRYSVYDDPEIYETQLSVSHDTGGSAF